MILILTECPAPNVCSHGVMFNVLECYFNSNPVSTLVAVLGLLSKYLDKFYLDKFYLDKF